MKAKNKKIVFDDTSNRHAQLKVRLQHDGLTQAEFFRSMVSGYLNKDEEIVQYLRRYKLKNKKQSKRNMKYVDKDIDKGNVLMEKYGLHKEELEDIFDLIAEEHPDL